MIGKLEEVVMLAVLRSGGDALASTVYEQVVASTAKENRPPAFGAVYTTMTRMVTKGMLSQGSTVDPRGRDRKTFTVTAAGQRELSAGIQQSARLGAYKFAGAM